MPIVTNQYMLENADSRNQGTTGKEIWIQVENVTLASSAATNINSHFAAGEKVYAVPAYPITVGSDGKIDVDFSAAPDLATVVLILGKPSNLKASYND